MSKLRIEGVSRTFPPARAGAAADARAGAVKLDVADNDFITILGPSGCGKSTLLGSSPGSTALPPAACCSTASR